MMSGWITILADGSDWYSKWRPLQQKGAKWSKPLFKGMGRKLKLLYLFEVELETHHRNEIFRRFHRKRDFRNGGLLHKFVGKIGRLGRIWLVNIAHDFNKLFFLFNSVSRYLFPPWFLQLRDAQNKIERNRTQVSSNFMNYPKSLPLDSTFAWSTELPENILWILFNTGAMCMHNLSNRNEAKLHVHTFLGFHPLHLFTRIVFPHFPNEHGKLFKSF